MLILPLQLHLNLQVRQELFWDEKIMHFLVSVSVVVRDFSSGSFRGIYEYGGLF